MVFLPKNVNQSNHCIKVFENEINRQNLKILGWRNVPVDSKVVGSIASKSQPEIKQVFITTKDKETDEAIFNLKLFKARKIAENLIYSSELSEKNTFIFQVSAQKLLYTKDC